MELHLASMENVTCWAFRKLCHGTTDSYTGMMSMNYLVKRTKAWKEVDTFPISKQRQWVQVATSKESECAEFIGRLQREMDADKEKDHLYGIQLNASCPSPEILRLGQGPALIKRPLRVGNLIKELLKQDKYKVSIKVRLGLNSLDIRQRKIFTLFEELEKIKDPNFSSVSVHFKHAKEHSFTPYDYSLLKEMLSFKLPLVINGGINSYKDYNNIVKNIPNRKNIIGIMVGRTALINPDCFVQMNNMFNPDFISPRTPESIKKEFDKLILEHEPKSIYLERIKKHCPWYS